MNQKITIAINREYGSGGRTIATMLSKDLGIHYYDKEIARLAADDSGIAEELFVRASEEFKGAPIFSFGPDVYDGEILPPSDKDYTSPKNLFACQARVMKHLCDTEPCILVGHGGGYVLRNRKNVVRVFVHAPEYYLKEMAQTRISLTGKDLEKYIEKENKRRADYNYYYTGEKWDDAHYYDLCLDSSKLGFEKCVELIKGYMKIRFDGIEF
ncbi:MAG: cytidylate kinase-like family protein [Lachnospiraceae bacterium]|nr:cytidylate kinase-like family protein [Lachnospiraceae bacterium]